MRKAESGAEIDQELFGHLSRMALFRSRDVVTMHYLRDAANRWFNKFNTSAYSDVEIAAIIANTVAAVMTVPKYELEAWHLMAGREAQENMWSAVAMARHGVIPKRGFMAWLRRTFGATPRAIPSQGDGQG